jgi:hypothetical protein
MHSVHCDSRSTLRPICTVHLAERSIDPPRHVTKHFAVMTMYRVA